MCKVASRPLLSFIHFVVSNDSVCGERRPRSDCADAQADLGLRSPHMPEDMFSHGTDQIVSIGCTVFHAIQLEEHRHGAQCVHYSIFAKEKDHLTWTISASIFFKWHENLHLKMSSVYVVCWIFLQTFQTYFFCIQANSVYPDQTAPTGAIWSGSTLFAKKCLLKTQADDKADGNCCDWQFKS